MQRAFGRFMGKCLLQNLGQVGHTNGEIQRKGVIVMKKVILIIGIVVLVAAIVVCGGHYLINKPEGALLTKLENAKIPGLSSLQQQVSEKMEKAADTISKVTDGAVANSVIALFGKQTPAAVQAQAQKIRWEIEDVTAGGDSAAAMLRFCYADRLSGKLYVAVVRDGQGWRLEKIAFSELERQTAP